MATTTIGGIPRATAQLVLSTKTVDKSVDELRRARPSAGRSSMFSSLRKNYPTAGQRLKINGLRPITRVAAPRTRVDRLSPAGPPRPRRSSAQLRKSIPVNRLARLAFWPHRSRNDAAATA